jgi:hypothetical protein
MPQRTTKHKSRRQRNLEQGLNEDGTTTLISIKGTRVLLNYLVDDGTCPLDRAIGILQAIHDQLGHPTTIVACAHCAVRVGIKKCGGCPSDSTLRYCSKNCQIADWATHKLSCGSAARD